MSHDSVTVVVERTSTVTVVQSQPAVTTTVASPSTSPVVVQPVVTTTVSPAPTVTDLERDPGLVETIEVGGPQGLPGPMGPPGPEGGTSVGRTAAAALGGHRVVRSVDADQVDYADVANAGHGDDTLGLSLGAAASGDPIQVQRTGSVTFAGWAWTPGLPVFLGADALLTQSPPDELDGAAFFQAIGHAEDATTVFLSVQPPIYY